MQARIDPGLMQNPMQGLAAPGSCQIVPNSEDSQSHLGGSGMSKHIKTAFLCIVLRRRSETQLLPSLAEQPIGLWASRRR